MESPGPTFADVLDAHLGSPPVEAWRPLVDARPDPGMWFCLSGRWAAGTVRTRAGRDAYGAAAPAQGAPPVSAQSGGHGVRRSSRPRARLDAAGRDALLRLRQWGAPLPDDLDEADLKRAYRRLARQYHPDRHAGAGAATRAALGGAFHQVHLAYRAVAAALAANPGAKAPGLRI